MNTGATDIQTSLENSVKNEIRPTQHKTNTVPKNINTVKMVRIKYQISMLTPSPIGYVWLQNTPFCRKQKKLI